jgi:hypothetical protein
MNIKNRKQDETSWDRTGWESGIIPNIRLIEIILSDELQIDFLNRNDAEARTELDAHNTESEKLSFFEKVRIKFNDPVVKIRSMVLNDSWGRQFFLESHDCNWEQLKALDMSPIPNAKTCKVHYSRLNNALGSIFNRWKNSGNGDDQIDATLEEEKAPVELDKIPTQGGDRLDFLGNHNICVMYFWFCLIKTSLFLDARNEFPDQFIADDGIAPSFEINSSVGTGGSSKTSKKSKAGAVDNRAVEQITGEIGKLKDFFTIENATRNKKDDIRALKEDRDRLLTERNTIREEILRLTNQKRILKQDNLKYKLQIVNETVGLKIAIIQEFINDTDDSIKTGDEELVKKKVELEEIMNKIKNQEDLIVQSEEEMRRIEDKTPKRSGNSLNRRGRTNPPSTVLITGEHLTKQIPFDTPNVSGITPAVAETGSFESPTRAPTQATTPTLSGTQLNEWMNSKRGSEEENRMVNKRKHTSDADGDDNDEIVETNGHTAYLDEDE